MLSALLAWVREAGAASEADTERDGAFSYAAESHAAGLGLAAGWFATATGRLDLLGVVYAAAVYGRAHARHDGRAEVFRDVAEEPHYALGGVVVGAAFGTVVGVAVS